MPIIRVSISLIFLMNGYVVGSWAPIIPDLLIQLAIGEGTLGMLLLVFGCGSLVAIPTSGYLVKRYGSTKPVKVVTILLSFILIPIVIVDTTWGTALILFVFGGLMGGMDVAINSNALAVERRLQYPIMSSCHGCWSLGALLGSFFGGMFLERFGRWPHALTTSAIGLPIALVVISMLLDDSGSLPEDRKTFALPKTLAPCLLGVMALFAMLPGELILDWGAIYFRNELGASIAEASHGFATYSTAMAILRFGGDRVRQTFGTVLTVRIGAVIAIFGLLLISSEASQLVALIGFALVGLGLSNLVPIAFAAAANTPDSSGMGLSVATSIGYGGILIAPPLIGFAVEQVGFATIFLTAISLLVCILFLSSHTAQAEHFRSRSSEL